MDDATAGNFELVRTTYTLLPDAFADRHAPPPKGCGPDKPGAAVVRSITVIEVDGSATDNLNSTLAGKLKADTSLTGLFGSGTLSASTTDTLDKIAKQVTKTSVQKFRSALSVGFDVR